MEMNEVGWRVLSYKLQVGMDRIVLGLGLQIPRVFQLVYVAFALAVLVVLDCRSLGPLYQPYN